MLSTGLASLSPPTHVHNACPLCRSNLDTPSISANWSIWVSILLKILSLVLSDGKLHSRLSRCPNDDGELLAVLDGDDGEMLCELGDEVTWTKIYFLNFLFRKCYEDSE